MLATVMTKKRPRRQPPSQREATVYGPVRGALLTMLTTHRNGSHVRVRMLAQEYQVQKARQRSSTPSKG